MGGKNGKMMEPARWDARLAGVLIDDVIHMTIAMH